MTPPFASVGGTARRTLIVVAALVGTVMPAAAEDVVAYRVQGVAPTATGDTRTVALDDAFARAVRSALAALVPAAARTDHQEALDRELVAHSRLWITAFTVTQDKTGDARRELMVTVQIDRDRMRAQLERLQIPTAPAFDAAKPPVIAIAVHVTAPSRDRAVLSAVATEALTTVFRSAGFEIAASPDGSRAGMAGDVAARSDTDTVARTAAAVRWLAAADIALGEASFVRGLPRDVVVVTVRVRASANSDSPVVAASPGGERPQRVVESAATATAFADAIEGGIKRAIAAATADVVPRLRASSAGLPPAAAANGDATMRVNDMPVAEPDSVIVRLPSGAPYSLVFATQRLLSTAKGVQSASLRRLSSAGWVIGATTRESADRIAQIVAQSSNVPVAVKVVRGAVEVTGVGESAP